MPRVVTGAGLLPPAATTATFLPGGYQTEYMNLYFLRHGVAMERDPESFPDDSLRPLTLKGEDRVRIVCSAVQALELSFDAILSSPYLRCRQTAEIVVSELGLRRVLEFRDELTPAGDPKTLIRAINRLRPVPQDVLIIGHEPYLSELLSMLISGQPDAAIDLKKNGLAKVEIDKRPRFGRCAALTWLLTPRQFALFG